MCCPVCAGLSVDSLCLSAAECADNMACEDLELVTACVCLHNYSSMETGACGRYLHPSHPHSSSRTTSLFYTHHIHTRPTELHHCFTPITSTLVLQNYITDLHPSHPHSSYRTIYNTIKYSLLSLCREICFLARHLHKNVQYS